MKSCFKCGAEKPLSEFYKHPQMADGHVNKCKECNKRDVTDNRRDKVDYYRAYDRERGSRQTPEYVAEYRKRFPEKYAAHGAVHSALRSGKLDKLDACECCGSQGKIEAHHPSYAPEMRLCVTWLCSPCHSQAHAMVS